MGQFIKRIGMQDTSRNKRFLVFRHKLLGFFRKRFRRFQMSLKILVNARNLPVSRRERDQRKERENLMYFLIYLEFQ